MSADIDTDLYLVDLIESVQHCIFDNTFDSLIYPLNRHDFFKRYYDDKPVHIRRNNKNFYRRLIGKDHFSELFVTHQFEKQDIQVKGPRINLAAQELLGEERFNSNLLNSAISQGATVIMRGLQKYSLPIAEFVSSLQSDLAMSIGANSYITPAKSHPASCHFDTHGVMILQVEGQKFWNVWDNPYERPLPHHIKHKNTWKNKATKHQEILVEQGDLLYLPRGFLHNAFCGNQNSIHLTLGMNSFSILDLWNSVIEDSLESDWFLNRTLTDIKKCCAKELDEYIDNKLNITNVRKSLHKINCERIAKKTPLVKDLLSNLTVGITAKYSDYYEISPFVEVLLEENEKEQIKYMVSDGQREALTQAEASILSCILDVKRFKCSEIMSSSSPELIGLLKKLLAKGLLIKSEG